MNCPDPNCPYAARAREASHDAIETAGGAVAIASATHTKVDALASEVHELKSKVSLATVIAGAMGAIAVIVAAVLGFLAVMAPSKVTALARQEGGEAGRQEAAKMQKSTETITADAAQRGAEIGVARAMASRNPDPIQRAPDRVASLPKTR